MPARRVPNRTKKLRGTFKRTQALPELVYSAPQEPGGLNAGQRALLRARPKGLPRRLALHYRELVRLAPWLEAGDRGLLLCYVSTWDRYRVAEQEICRLLKDPAFADPASEASKAGALYNRLVHRNATLLLQVGRQLGFTPAGRQALGIEARKEQPPAAADPWAQLRMIPGGKTDPDGRDPDGHRPSGRS